MQKEYSNKKQPTLSLYTDEEIEGVSTSSSLAKSNTALHTEVNFSEVSSTSEDTYQLPSTSSKSIFMDLYEEDIANSEADVPVVKDNADVDKKKSMYKLGLSLLGEYTDGGNDSEEEVMNSLGVKRDKSKKTVQMSTDKNSKAECGSSVISNENPNKLETGSSGVSNEALLSDDKISLTGGKEDDFDIHALLDDSLARSDKSKEDGQLSASDSSDSERSSDSKKDPKKSKEGKKDKSKKKDKKKKKKKRKKQKQQVERKEPSDKRDDEEKRESNQNRNKTKSRSKSRSQSRSKNESQSKSLEKSEKPKSIKQSRSRSRDKSSRHRRRSRSRSQDKRSKDHSERSRRSRSRSSSKRHSTSRRNRHSKYHSSRSRSRNRSTSPSNKRRERQSSTSKTRSSKRDSPSSRKRKLSRSPSPYKHKEYSSEHRKSKSPKRRKSKSPKRRKSKSPKRRKSKSPKRYSHSPGRKSAPSEKNNRSPTSKKDLSSKRSRSPKKREHKSSISPPRKMSHRTSSPSDSLDSGHFTNIPLNKVNKADDPTADTKEAEEKMPAMEEEEEFSIPAKSEEDMEMQHTPSHSPQKAWEDEFDFVFTERLSPKQGTEKSVEDVLFGKEITDPKTPDFKKKTVKESIKSNVCEVPPAKENKESKEETLNGNKDIVCKEQDEPEEKKTQQLELPDSQSTQSNSVVEDAESISNLANSKDTIADTTAAKTDVVNTCNADSVKETADNDTITQTLEQCEKSAFLPSKVETIPFLGDIPPAPPPENRDLQRPIIPAPSQLGLLGPLPVGMGLLPTPSFHGQSWAGLKTEMRGIGLNIPRGSQGLLPTPGTLPKLSSKEDDIGKIKKEPFIASTGDGKFNFNSSPMDMEMSSPEGDIIDRLNEEFWKQQQQQQNQDSVKKTVREEPKELFVESAVRKQSLSEEPYEPETGVLIPEEFEEDLNSITDPKERKKKEKEQQKEKTKVQELIDRLHRQARVEEEVKHVLKAYYKHKDITKDQYKSILRRAVPQITNSSSAIDPERIRSFVKKCIAKIKNQHLHSD